MRQQPNDSLRRCLTLAHEVKVVSLYKLRPVTLDGKREWKITCPGCGVDGYLDADQFYGRVSTLCGECHRFHNTINFAAFVRFVNDLEGCS